MSLHELEFAAAIADKVMAVSNGKVENYGQAKDIITGEIIEKLYHMPKGHGDIIAGGIWDYTNSIKKLCN